MLASQHLVLVQILNLNSGTVRTRRSFGIIIIDHIYMSVNPRVSKSMLNLMPVVIYVWICVPVLIVLLALV